MEKLGIEPVLLLTQIFNFLLMVVVLTKLLYKPVLKMLEERRKKIEEGLAYTERMKKEMEKSDRKREEIIDKAKEEARIIIEQGKASGRRLEAEIIEKAHGEASAIIDKGKAELVRERLELERVLRRQTVEIAATMVETVLTDVLDIKAHRTIIAKKLDQLSRLIK